MLTPLRATLSLWLAVFMLAACNQSPAPQAVPDPATIQAQAATGGAVWAWGLNDVGQATTVHPYAGLSYTAIAAGSSHSVMLRSDG